MFADGKVLTILPWRTPQSPRTDVRGGLFSPDLLIGLPDTGRRLRIPSPCISCRWRALRAG